MTAANTALNLRQRVRDAIGRPLTFYLGLHGEARERRLRQALTEIGLDPDRYADRYPGELSDGQKQRARLACALATEPALIICGEVTSALDQLVAQEMLKLVNRLQRARGLTYLLFITPDLTTVSAIADEIIVIKGGLIVESAPRHDTRAASHPYTDLLLSSVAEMDPDWLDRPLARRRGVPATLGPSLKSRPAKAQTFLHEFGVNPRFGLTATPGRSGTVAVTPIYQNRETTEEKLA
jgi:peptide/nickel transport system ATP-binding protein